MLFRPSQPVRGFEFLIKYVNVPRTTVDSLHIVVTRHRNEPFCRAANVARQGPTLRMNILLVAFTPCSRWGRRALRLPTFERGILGQLRALDRVRWV